MSATDPKDTVKYRNVSLHGGKNTRLGGRLLEDIEATQLLNVDLAVPGIRRKRLGLSQVANLGTGQVRPPGTACPTITLDDTLPDGDLGASYTGQVTASGGAPPYSYALAGGALPTGLVMSLVGAITGTPTVAGTFGFTVTATDAQGCTGQRAYVVVVPDVPGVCDPGLYPTTLYLRVHTTHYAASSCSGAPSGPGTGYDLATLTKLTGQCSWTGVGAVSYELDLIPGTGWKLTITGDGCNTGFASWSLSGLQPDNPNYTASECRNCNAGGSAIYDTVEVQTTPF